MSLLSGAGMLGLRSPGTPRLEESQPGPSSSPPAGVGVLQFQKVKKPLWGWESLFCCLGPGGGAGGCAEDVVGGLSLLWGLCLIPGRMGYTPYLRVPEHWTGCSGPSGSHSPLCRAQHQLTLALALPTSCSSCPNLSRGSAVRVSLQGPEVWPQWAWQAVRWGHQSWNWGRSPKPRGLARPAPLPACPLRAPAGGGRGKEKEGQVELGPSGVQEPLERGLGGGDRR
nr:uncharacterized protein LOC112930335 isoform X2 [Vulpes vulpes]